MATKKKKTSSIPTGEWIGIKAIRKIGNKLQILKNPGPLKRIKVKVVVRTKKKKGR